MIYLTEEQKKAKTLEELERYDRDLKKLNKFASVKVSKSFADLKEEFNKNAFFAGLPDKNKYANFNNIVYKALLGEDCYNKINEAGKNNKGNGKVARFDYLDTVGLFHFNNMLEIAQETIKNKKYKIQSFNQLKTFMNSIKEKYKVLTSEKLGPCFEYDENDLGVNETPTERKKLDNIQNYQVSPNNTFSYSDLYSLHLAEYVLTKKESGLKKAKDTKYAEVYEKAKSIPEKYYTDRIINDPKYNAIFIGAGFKLIGTQSKLRTLISFINRSIINNASKENREVATVGEKRNEPVDFLKKIIELSQESYQIDDEIRDLRNNIADCLNAGKINEAWEREVEIKKLRDKKLNISKELFEARASSCRQRNGAEPSTNNLKGEESSTNNPNKIIRWEQTSLLDSGADGTTENISGEMNKE